MAQISRFSIIVIVIVIIGAVIFSLMATGYIKSDLSGSSGTSSNQVYPPAQQGTFGEERRTFGGKRNKKLKSKTMGTSGIYLLLGAVLVGYITAKFV